jgi:hypothetical protein
MQQDRVGHHRVVRAAEIVHPDVEQSGRMAGCEQ